MIDASIVAVAPLLHWQQVLTETIETACPSDENEFSR